MNVSFLLNTMREGVGITNRAINIALELDKRGHNVNFVTLDKAKRDLGETIAIDEVRLTKKRKMPYRLLNGNNWVFRTIAQSKIQAKLQPYNPDFLFVDYTPLDKQANALRKKLGYKVVYTYHGVADSDIYEGKQREQRVREKQNIINETKKADILLSISEFASNELKQHGIESQIIYNGVDTDHFHPIDNPMKLTKTGPTLVYVGRYVKHKGIHLLLQSFLLARKKVNNLVLYMFGYKTDPGYFAEIQEFVKSNNLEKSVLLFDDVHDDLLPHIYGFGDIYVSATLHELFGMTFVEAAACGVPSIAYNIKSLPEVVKHNQTGFLCEPEDIEGFAEAIIDLTVDEKKRQQFSANARNFSKKFDWQFITDQVEDVLRKNS